MDQEKRRLIRRNCRKQRERKTLLVLVWFGPFISNCRVDFSIHFVAGWPKEKLGLFVALRKMWGWGGVVRSIFSFSSFFYTKHSHLAIMDTIVLFQAITQSPLCSLWNSGPSIKGYEWSVLSTNPLLSLYAPSLSSSPSIEGSLWDSYWQTDPQLRQCLTLQTWESNEGCQHGETTFINSWLDITSLFVSLKHLFCWIFLPTMSLEGLSFIGGLRNIHDVVVVQLVHCVTV